MWSPKTEGIILKWVLEKQVGTFLTIPRLGHVLLL
jgi:hypothetical protein